MAVTNKPNDRKDSALITGKSAANNPNLDRVLKALEEGYSPNRFGKSTRQLRIDHTAMIPLDRPVFGVRTDGQGNKTVRLLFRAGWYLSPEENFVAKQLLEDEETREVNEQIWAKMEKEGYTVEKEAAEQVDAKVVA